jgi:hypothetical protein
MQLGRKIIPKQRRVLVAVLLSILGMVARSGAQGLESTQLPSPDLAAYGFFGTAVSLSADGQTALVSSPGLGVQKVFVYVRGSSGWVLEAGLSPDPPGFFYGNFGSVVALSGDGRVALVTDLNEPCSTSTYPCGAVYLYERTGGGIWVLREHLVPPSWLDFEFFFGSALALSADGSTVLIGRPSNDCVRQPCGVVFVYARAGDSWNLVDKLRASNPSVQKFGSAISLSPDGGTALIGAPGEACSAGSSCGEAYVFARGGGGWSEQARLTPSGGSPEALFGSAVGLSADGRIALVGAPPADDLDPQGTGSVYAFVHSGGSWSQTQKIAGGPQEAFGRSLALAADGRSALLGASLQDCAAGADCGAVYQVTRGAGGLWSPPRSLASFPAGAQGGAAVALSWDGSIGLAGAPRTSCAAGLYCGAVHVFSGLLAPAVIPTLGGAGLAALTLALILSALILLRRRRAL